MRLFVAVELPQPLLDEVADLVQSLQAPVDACDPQQLRWTRREQWHVTLAFLGEVDAAILADLRPRLVRAAARHQPLEVRLSQGGHFGTNTLWAGVTGDREQLRGLARSVQAAARRAGIPVEDRGYRPHLTLARGRQRADLRPWVGRLATWASSAWTVADVALVRSRLGPPATYEVLERFALGR